MIQAHHFMLWQAKATRYEVMTENLGKTCIIGGLLLVRKRMDQELLVFYDLAGAVDSECAYIN